MKTLRCFSFPIGMVCLSALLSSLGVGAVHAADWNLSVLDQVLATVAPGQTRVQVGDTEIPVANLRAWRNELAGGPQTQLASASGITLWTGGNVYYTFSNNVSAVKQKAFLDAAAEWALFANLRFIARSNQANYVLVYENPSLSGGQATLGMAGGQQFLQVGPNAWNRPTLCHELGHTLGLVHEHQRSDRDTYVVVVTNNLTPGSEANFTKLTTSQNFGPYDFYSVMHYGSNTFSVNPATQNTLVPQLAYTNWFRVFGQLDPVLSALDRAGMATNYGPGPALSSVVTNTLDNGPGSLRAAMYYAFDHPGTTITFNIPTTDPGYSNSVFNILPSDALPSLVNAMTLDGTSQPTNSNPNGPEILLNGSQALAPGLFPNGLRFRGSNCVARGLVINGFSASAVWMDGATTVSNALTGCYIGINAAGTAAASNGLPPVVISGGASGNSIGGTNAAQRNVIGGSLSQGLTIRDAGTRGNVVQGNFIGLNAAGTAAISNTFAGIQIYGGAQSNIIGGATVGARNVISGNASQGVAISDANTSGNVVAGNFIGLTGSGAAALPNGWAGVDIFGSASSNRIGGYTSAERNVISGNSLQGVKISGAGSRGNLIVGNYIGLNANGTAAIGNAASGIEIFGGVEGTSVGGTAPGAGNIIGGNLAHGVLFANAGTSNNVVQGNWIGLNATGTVAGNTQVGVIIAAGAQSNLIGGFTAAARNVISANGHQGIAFGDANTRGNVVAGNYIGLNPAGTAALGNAWAGVNLYGAADGNVIGGSVSGAGNVISGNLSQGVLLQDAGTRNHLVQGNLIGLDAAGAAAVPNAWSGIEIYNGPSANFIGGAGGARNFISGNANYGITIDYGSSANLVQGNTIGLNGANTLAVPNAYSGVALYVGAVSNQIGGTTLGAANLISGNSSDGISLFDAATTNNSIRGNCIVSNAGAGIALYTSANRSAAAPSLVSAVLGTNTVVRGTLTSLASTTFQIDYYANPAPAAGAEGMTYLGARSVTTSAGGTVTFTNALGALVPAGRVITATATDPAGNTSPFSSGVAVTATSTPNDGIPDAWRAAMFGGSGTTTNGSSCATCDPDGDGMNNRAEFLSGTNPTNAASVFKLTALSPAPTGDVASLPSVSGIVYRVEVRDDLAASPWALLLDQLVGTGGPLLINDTNTLMTPKRFYRAGVLW